jgi:hypothetical protein
MQAMLEVRLTLNLSVVRRTDNTSRISRGLPRARIRYKSGFSRSSISRGLPRARPTPSPQAPAVGIELRRFIFLSLSL